ncbi:MAG: 2-oxo acid dehydrogenase subunit E2 [Pseudomonadales bacterium]
MTDGKTTAEQFHLPDLGEGLNDAEVVSWLVGSGDRVVTSQPLLTVETDKAVVDIPSPRSGVIAECLAAAGDVVEVGEPLLRFAAGAGRADAGAVVGELESPPAGPTAARPVPEEPALRASPSARRERLIGVRRAMARRMADACARVACATVTGEADVSAWQGEEGAGDSLMVRLVRAVGIAASAVPLLNAAYDDTSGVLRRNAAVHLGIAMESADGLFVPVLRDAAGKTAEDVATELEHLRQAVADRTIRPEALRGQTITLSNFGAVGGLHAEMVVVPPQVAVVGAGRIFERLVPEDSGTAVARMLPLSVSFDHRVVTGWSPGWRPAAS